MGMESARAWLTARGLEERIREFPVSSAVALSCDELERASEAAGWVDVTKDQG